MYLFVLLQLAISIRTYSVRWTNTKGDIVKRVIYDKALRFTKTESDLQMFSHLAKGWDYYACYQDNILKIYQLNALPLAEAQASDVQVLPAEVKAPPAKIEDSNASINQEINLKAPVTSKIGPSSWVSNDEWKRAARDDI